MAKAIAMIDDIRANEVQAVFERMLANPPALAIAGKGASARAARQLAACLVAGSRSSGSDAIRLRAAAWRGARPER